MNAITRTIDDRLMALETKRVAWEVSSDDNHQIDWSTDIRMPRWLPRRYVATALSQFLHGERVTAEICRNSMAEWQHEETLNICIKGQIQDEERHAGLFRRYMEKLGDFADVDPVLQMVLEEAAAWKGAPEARLVAINILLEGEALRMLDSLGNLLPCPLFAQLSQHIARDEARHVAMGKIVLRHRLASVEKGERLDIYHWVAKLWRECALGMLAGLSIPGIVMARHRRQLLETAWAQQTRAMVDIGLIRDVDAQGCPL